MWDITAPSNKRWKLGELVREHLQNKLRSEMAHKEMTKMSALSLCPILLYSLFWQCSCIFYLKTQMHCSQVYFQVSTFCMQSIYISGHGCRALPYLFKSCEFYINEIRTAAPASWYLFQWTFLHLTCWCIGGSIEYTWLVLSVFHFCILICW